MSDRQTVRHQRSHSSAVDSLPWPTVIMLALFAAMIVWAPLPLGSNRPFFLHVLAVWAGCLAVGWSGLVLAGLAGQHPRSGALWPAALCLASVLILVALQITDLTQIQAFLGDGVLALGHATWIEPLPLLGSEMSAYVSVNPAKAGAATLKLLFYAAVFYTAFQLAQSERGARGLLWAVAISGAVCTLVGIGQASLGIDLGRWLSGEIWAESARRFSSTFVNPNNFATFAGLALVSVIGLVFPVLSKGIILDRGRTVLIRTAANTVFGPALPGLGLGFLLLGAVLLSGSRGGSLAVLIGLVVLAGILAFGGRRHGPQSGGLWGFGIAVVLAGAVFAVGNGILAERMDDLATGETTRSRLANGAWTAATAAPVLGNGFGAFVDYYPSYASGYVPGLADKAHHDYLEALADLGFVGGGLLIAIPLTLALLCLRGVLVRKRAKAIPAVGVAASVLVGVHALLDFSLQIPAVGALYYALLGAGAAQSWRNRS